MNKRSYGKLGYEVSALGMGCMRLPRLYDGSDVAQVDREKAYELIRYAVEHGVNYFDSALTYHNKDSEAVLGEALEGGLREKVKVATKQPLREMPDNSYIRPNLERTLKKLRTDYLDLYLIHNITPGTWDEIRERGIYDEFVRFRDEGLIRAIGFSYHGDAESFKKVVDYYPWDMCQIQQNLLDVDKEVTGEGIRYAGSKGLAVVVMEPLRGGGLATPPAAVQAIYDGWPEKRSPVEWAFRHVLDYPEVSCVLSGMTTLEQLKENIDIFSKPENVAGCLSEGEQEILRKVRAKYETLASIPCTGCEYCMPCPNGVNIPGVFSRYNEGVMFENFAQPKRSYLYLTRGGGGVDRCVECGACEPKCPQNIAIMKDLKKAHEQLQGWIE